MDLMVVKQEVMDWWAMEEGMLGGQWATAGGRGWA